VSRNPRALSRVRTSVPNILPEQFALWRKPTWRFIPQYTTGKDTTEEWLLDEDDDITELCWFGRPARGTRLLLLGYRNMRVSERGEVGLIVKPMVLSFRLLLNLYSTSNFCGSCALAVSNQNSPLILQD
jgi:hypothetical protein